MKNKELLSLLVLSNTNGIGPIRTKKLITHFKSAEEVLRANRRELLLVNGCTTEIIKELKSPRKICWAEKQLENCEKNNISIFSFLDKNYPPKLRHCIDAPILLFTSGNINWINRPILSVVGTRKITTYGKAVCEKIIEDLKDYNPIIVSGFAYGTDIWAHKKAIDSGLQTVAVLAHGLDYTYPSIHKKHIHSLEKNGGFISEYPLNTPALPESFLQRNRIIAGVAEGTLIIESAYKGGSMSTADYAFQYNREVMAIPGRSTDIMSQGCNLLIQKNKAALCQNAKDIAEILNWNSIPRKSIQKSLFINLNKEESLFLEYLKTEKKHLDVIALETKLPIYKAAQIAISLELKGLIRPLPGKLFEKI